MDRYGSAKDLFSMSKSLPNRLGKRPITIGSPLHVQSSGHGDGRALRQLLDEVITWPDVEEGPLSVSSAEMFSFQVAEEVATADPSVFITGREFARVLLTTPTIYLTLPLSSAHWAIIRGWAEPHSSSTSGLVPPGVMVLYTPRDNHELSVCRSLFWISYNFSLSENRKNSVEWNALWFGADQYNDIEEGLAVAV
jgi:Family of unknown function (DUF5519)